MVNLSWVIPSFLLCGTAPTFVLLWIPVKLLSIFFPKKYYTWFDEKIWSTYQRMVLFFYEYLSNSKIIFYGDYEYLKKGKENVIYMSNHQCAVDWIVADMVAARQGGIGRIRYVIKEELKFIPLYGSYFYEHGCIYVNRDKFQAKKAIESLEYLKKNNIGCWLVIFPEGTRVDPKASKVMDRSREFAKSQGLVPLEHHLTPRLRGTELTLQHVGDHIDAVYDITVLYSDSVDRTTNVRQGAPGMFEWFQRPRTLHIRLDRIPISEVPREGDPLKNWMYGRFLKKDKWFADFISATSDANCLGDKHEDPGLEWPLSIYETLPAFCLFTGVNLLLMLTSTGRVIYFTVATLGTIFGWLIAVMRI